MADLVASGPARVFLRGPLRILMLLAFFSLISRLFCRSLLCWPDYHLDYHLSKVAVLVFLLILRLHVEYVQFRRRLHSIFLS